MIAGRYSLDREVGRGGMGAVWLGRDEVLGRPVAMKSIGMAPGATAPDLERAEREARLAARLNHPHVVAVFDLVRDEDRQWLVMEYVDGSTLADVVRARGPLPPDEAAALVGQAADGLAAAHAAGIVHRDVKPSNILVGAGGHVKLTDFGIARADADAALTQTGLVTGSPAYLAPEVASGRTATDASDVWSLGATLYSALAGHPPYEVGDNLLGALYRIVHEEPPRLAEAGWLGPLLEATMTREPRDRWSMAQVRDVLQAGPGAVVTALPPSASLADTHGTQLLSRPGSGAVVVPPPPAEPGEPAAGPVPAEDRRRSRLPILALVLGLAAVALLTVAAFNAGLGGDDGGTRAETPTSTPSTTPSVTPSETPSGTPTSPAADPRPTARSMTRFVQDYLRTAASDSRAGFAMLGAGFQAESEGFAGYDGFWGDVAQVSDVRVTDTDVETLTVSYRYTRQLADGARVTDDTTIRLSFDDGRYKIVGEIPDT